MNDQSILVLKYKIKKLLFCRSLLHSISKNIYQNLFVHMFVVRRNQNVVTVVAVVFLPVTAQR